MADTGNQKKRVYRNIAFSQILSYRLPPAGIVSILHRISGVLLFLSLPLTLYWFGQSLYSEASFAMLKAWTSCTVVKLVILGLAWAFLYHFCAGIRHVCMDLHIGVNRQAGNRSAIGVLSLSILLSAAVALKLFGVF